MKGSVGERFSKLRIKNGFTQSQVAHYLEVDQSYISKYEKDERQASLFSIAVTTTIIILQH